jgi:hypothetical protein
MNTNSTAAPPPLFSASVFAPTLIDVMEWDLDTVALQVSSNASAWGLYVALKIFTRLLIANKT